MFLDRSVSCLTLQAIIAITNPLTANSRLGACQDGRAQGRGHGCSQPFSAQRDQADAGGGGRGRRGALSCLNWSVWGCWCVHKPSCNLSDAACLSSPAVASPVHAQISPQLRASDRNHQAALDASQSHFEHAAMQLSRSLSMLPLQLAELQQDTSTSGGLGQPFQRSLSRPSASPSRRHATSFPGTIVEVCYTPELTARRRSAHHPSSACSQSVR